METSNSKDGNTSIMVIDFNGPGWNINTYYGKKEESLRPLLDNALG